MYKLIAFIIDIILIRFGYYIAFFNLKIKGTDSPANYEALEKALPYICIIAAILLYTYGLYTLLNRKWTDIFFSLILVEILLTISAMAVTFLVRAFAFPRSVLLYGGIIQLILLLLWRTLIWQISLIINRKKPILVIGRYPQIEEAVKKLIIASGNLYRVKYMFNLEKDFKLAHKLVKDVDYVFLCSDINNEDKSKVFSYCLAEGKNMFIIPELFEITIKNAELEQFDDMPIFKVGNLSFSMEQRVIKRLIDILISLIGLIITCPVMVIIAIVIKITSPGSVLLKQERVTRGDKIFTLYKFRTMIENAEEITGPTLATEEDPRITTLGNFLRATRLDEIPQFINVFLGHMSIVGPRPERPYFIQTFQKEMPDYEYRLTVKAGITGLAQVMGKYTTTPQDKLRYDLFYIRNYSFWLDMKLIMQTLKVIFIKSSAEGKKKDLPLDELLKSMGYRKNMRKGYIEISEQ